MVKLNDLVKGKHLLNMCGVFHSYLVSLTEHMSDILFVLRLTQREDSHPFFFILIKTKLTVMGTGPSMLWSLSNMGYLRFKSLLVD